MSDTPNPPQPDAFRRQLALVAAVALLVRLVHLWQWHHCPFMSAPVMDALYHHELAQKFAASLSFGSEPFFRAPLYPLFLGVLYRLLGVNPLGVRLVQMLIGSASCVLIALFGRRVAGPRVGLIAGLMAALYGPEIYFESDLQLPVLEVFFGAAMLLAFAEALALERSGESRSARRAWIIGGLCMGLGVLTRPNLLAFVPVLIIWLGIALGWRRGLVRGAWIVGLVALCVAPVTIRNRVVGHDNVLISSQGGVNLFIGNNPEADGSTAVVPGTRSTWWGGYYDTIAIAETAAGRKLRPSEVSRYWSGRAREFMTTEPAAFVALLVRKTVFLLNGFELPNNEEIYPLRSFSAVLAALVWQAGPFCFPFGLVLPLAVVGAGFAIRRRDSAFTLPLLYVAVYAATVVLFFVNARYRMPLLPALLVLAATGAMGLAGHVRRPHGWATAQAIAVLVVLLVLCNTPFYGLVHVDYAKHHNDLAAAYQTLGQYTQAEAELREAVRLNPYRAEGALGLAAVLSDQKRYREATETYQEVLLRWPNRAEALSGLGDVAFAQRDYKTARQWYDKALAVDPANTDLAVKAADARRQLGDTAGAEQQYLAATAGHQSREARAGLAQLYLNQRRYQEAATLAAQLRAEGDDSEGVLGLAAMAELSLGHMKEALAAANEVLDKNPHNPDAMLVVGVALWQAGQIEQAETILRQAADVAPKRSEIWSNLAAVQAVGTDHQAALQSAERALSLDPSNPQALYVRAGCRLERGEFEQAAADCRALLRLEPDNAGAKEMLERIQKR